MPLKFKNQFQSRDLPPGLRPVDLKRRRDREKFNSSKKIEKIYGDGGTPLIPSTAFWQFNDSPGASISDFIVTFTGNVEINWGDDTTETLTSGQTTQHTY